MILLRQAARSIWRAKRSYLACVILLAAGIMLYICFNLLYRNLHGAMYAMYRDQRFGDAFAQVTAMPPDAADRAAAVAGVVRADATLVADARVEIPGEGRTVTLRINSFVPGENDRLNNFLVTAGQEPDGSGLLLSEAFAAVRGLEVGDTLRLVIGGRAVHETVTGIVQSPEYVYAIPDAGQLFPDDETFGYGYMTAGRLGALAGRTGEANRLSVLLEEGVSFPAVEAELEDLLAPYGVRALTERKNQPSHAMLDQEVESIGSMSTSLPMVFILLAAVMLTILLQRMLQQERGQIGVLKAFGFTDRAILLHYVSYGAITGLAGGVLGAVLGLALNGSITDIYLDVFHLPGYRAAVDAGLLARGIAVGFAAGLLGALLGTRSILRLQPSEAMRPPAPPALRADWVGRIPPLRHLLDSFGYMAARNIIRGRFRSAFVVLGVAFAFAITAFMASFGEMVDIMMIDQFTKVELYDSKLTLHSPVPYTAALEEVRAVDGVRRAEGLLEMGVELRSGHISKTVSLTAMEADSRLYKIYDNTGGRTYPAPATGVILSDRLAGDLLVDSGDTVTLRTPYTGDTDIPLPVVAVIGSNLGGAAYIQLDSLWRLLDTPSTVSAVLVDTADTDTLRAVFLEADGVAGITHQKEARQIYDSMLETYDSMLVMMQVAGAGVAFVIIAATASISLSERGREYATMRVMGMYPREIGQVVGLEYWTLALAAILPGILLTRGLKEAMSRIIDVEMFSIPVYTAPSSFLKAAALCLCAVALSNWLARRKIARMDMVDVLKERG